jgi:katanin p80 WD40 repeat-containing subunit B1
MWTIGKPDAVLSLSAHASTVTCVRFDASEEKVLAGTEGGAIKLWDLATQKATVFAGHRAAVDCCEVHPFVSLIAASGSKDCCVKVWDARKKTTSSGPAGGSGAAPAQSLVTFRGHSDAVSIVRFTPDGRWIVSGGLDGEIRIWDLAAGKNLATFQTGGAVTSLDFHPQEFLMCSASDRRLCVWDLDTLTQLAVAEAHPSRVRVCEFGGSGGDRVAAVTQECVKVWTYEPTVECVEYADARWGNVLDYYAGVAAAVSGNFVSIYQVTKTMAPSSNAGALPVFPTHAQSQPSPSPVVSLPQQFQQNVQVQPQASHFQPQSIQQTSSGAAFNVPASGPSQPQPQAGSASAIPAAIVQTREQRERDREMERERQRELQRERERELLREREKEAASGRSEMMSITSDHASVLGVLTSRITHVRALATQYATGNAKGCFDASLLTKSPAVIADVLRHVQVTSLNLDQALSLLQVVHSALSMHGGAEEAAMEQAKDVWSAFRETVSSTLTAASLAVGVDLQREARAEKCRNMKRILDEVKSVIETHGWERDVSKRGDVARAFLLAYSS